MKSTRSAQITVVIRLGVARSARSPQQNYTFTDHYLDVAFDLSHVLFIHHGPLAGSNPSRIARSLEVISLPSYTPRELQIAKRYSSSPTREHGLRRKAVKFRRHVKRLILDYTHEAGRTTIGARDCFFDTQRSLEKIVTSHAINGAPLVIGDRKLPTNLGQPKFISEAAEKINKIGIAMGLAWTPSGGEILFIEATRCPAGATHAHRLARLT